MKKPNLEKSVNETQKTSKVLKDTFSFLFPFISGISKLVTIVLLDDYYGSQGYSELFRNYLMYSAVFGDVLLGVFATQLNLGNENNNEIPYPYVSTETILFKGIKYGIEKLKELK